MKTVTIIFLVLAGTIGHILGMQGDEDRPDVIEYTVTADTANLRSGPGTNFDIVQTVSKGDSVLIYNEEPGTSGWLRVFRAEEDDAYIADYLVERAPVRFYPVEQEPLVTITGSGKMITDIYELPQGLYRIDIVVQDNAFILSSITVEGDCRDDSLFNELNFDKNQLVMSSLFISTGCSVLFETDNVDGTWNIEIRDLLDEEFFLDGLLAIENGTSITGEGRSLTMGTVLEEGIWTISAKVQDQAFILHSHVLNGECDDTSVFNELNFDVNELEVSTVYRNSDEEPCIIYWESDNVDGQWELTFEKLR
jgi:hypothetical protein